MEKTAKYNTEKNKPLIEACKRNDRKAQVEVYDLYYKAMYNTSLRIVNDTLLAEDIMQESFLEAFNKLETFEWRSSFGSWLKRIVINKSLDKIRRKIDEIPVFEFEDQEDDNSLNDEPENNQCRLEEVKVALQLLPKDYKLILVLHLFEGYDHQEIAQILNLPYNNVRVRYMRAKRKLIEKVMESKSKHVLN